MKRSISILTMFAVFFTATVFTNSAAAQRGNCYNKCTNIQGLTEVQQNKITQLNTEHRTGIDALRSKRQSATTWEEKQQIGNQMISKRAEHRASVTELLTPEQAKVYNASCLYSNQNKKGKGNRKGNSNKGNGRGCRR